MGAPSEFHDDVHLDATEITGDRQYGEWGQCVATAKSTGERCRGYAQGPHGKCGAHGGDTPSKDENPDVGAGEGNENAEGNDGGAPEGNTNAATHTLYVASNRFYQDVLDDDGRELVDDIYEGYVERFTELNGEPVAPEEARLVEIAINHVKILHGDNWAVERPDSLDSGNALVDEETRVKTSQHGAHEETRYKETVVSKAQQRLRKEDRKWLKDYGLLGADAVDVSIDGQVDHDHGVDDATQDIIEDLAENLQA